MTFDGEIFGRSLHPDSATHAPGFRSEFSLVIEGAKVLDQAVGVRFIERVIDKGEFRGVAMDEFAFPEVRGRYKEGRFRTVS